MSLSKVPERFFSLSVGIFFYPCVFPPSQRGTWQPIWINVTCISRLWLLISERRPSCVNIGSVRVLVSYESCWRAGYETRADGVSWRGTLTCEYRQIHRQRHQHSTLSMTGGYWARLSALSSIVGDSNFGYWMARMSDVIARFSAPLIAKFSRFSLS